MNKPNKKGCIPTGDVCMLHEEPLICRHGCTQALPHICGKLKLEKKNFRINSENWDEIIVDEEKYLVNPKQDIWEIAQGEYKGEQLFTYDAAIRETKKAGKRIPTDEEFEKILKKKDDMPNIAYVGFRYTDGSFSNRGIYTNFWSSAESGTSAWDRHLSSGTSTVKQFPHDKAYGFSVRCLK